MAGVLDRLRRSSGSLVLGAIVAQTALLTAVIRSAPVGFAFAGVVALAVCAIARVVWNRRDRYRGVDAVVIPLAFGGLGMAIGQAGVVALAGARETMEKGAGHSDLSTLLIPAGMLLLCLPACVLFCSHDTCGGSRTRVVRRLTVLHLMMLLGMLSASWAAAWIGAAKGEPLWHHVAGLVGMVLGALAVVQAWTWERRRGVEDRCPRG